MKKVIVISSGKGGVGKTTTAVNLSAAMNLFGKDVLLVDGNLTTPNVGIHFGSPEVPINLNHVIKKEADAFEAVYEHDSGLKIMPSSLSIKELEKIKSEKLKDVKKDLQKVAEIIIVDSAAGLGNEALSAIDLADELVIVTNPEMPAITDALKLVKVAEKKKKPIKGIIVTRVRRNGSEMSSDEVKDMLEAPVLGMVPEDISVQESIGLKDALVHTHPKSKAARAYKEIAAKIADVYYDSDKDKEKILEKISKFISKITKKKK